MSRGKTTNQFSMEEIKELQSTISKIMAERHIPSLMLAIVTKDTTLFVGGLGAANLGAKQPVGKYTLFPMGSITKTFTALAVMRLAEQGKISLNGDLRKIAPEVPFNNPWEEAQPIKIVHLLEHTTGFDDVHFNAIFNRGEQVTEFNAVLKYKNSMTSRWRPGEREAYCNTDYVILGYLIEKLSGQSYSEFLAKEVLRPLAMEHSNFDENRQPFTASYAHGYEWDGARFNEIPAANIYGRGEGGLYSCAEDMAKFVRFFLGNGSLDGARLLSTDEVNRMEAPASTISARHGLQTGYGLGIQVDFLTSKYPFYGHDGLTIDFASRYGYNRQLGVGFAICGADVEPFTVPIIDFLTKPFPARALPVPAPLDLVAVGPYLGYYRLKTPRFQVLRFLEEVFHGYHVELRKDGLYAYGFKRPQCRLIPVTSTCFRKENETLPSMLLTTNEEGRKALYEQGTYYEKVLSPQISVERFLLLGGMIAGLASVLSLLIWTIMAVFKSLSWTEWRNRTATGFGVVCLMASFGAFAYLANDPINIGSFNVFTVSYFLGTLLFALLSMLGFINAIVKFKQTGSKWAKWYQVVTSTWVLYLVAFFYYYDLLGLRMWAF